jgi:predicted RNA-binding Zn ribbon-like protein
MDWDRMVRTVPTGRFIVVPAPAPTLCLAYANTLMWRGSDASSESLGDPGALFAWIERHERYPAAAVSELRAWAEANPAQGSQLFAAAIALRETIYRAFASIAARAAPADADFDALREAVAQCGLRSSLVREAGDYGWRIPAPAHAIEVYSTITSEDIADPWRRAAAGLLAPVLWSAADLLLDAGSRRIRQCANEKCLWLFVDASKSGTRRWCDMGACGNRAKAQRHYAKVRRA